MRLRIGLTGGIGSGKSTVAALLAQQGAALIDTDAIARQLALPGGDAIPAIEAEFGGEFIDAGGGLDRDRMRALAFSDRSAKLRLEAILHPLIGVETERQAGAVQAAVLVFDVPLLAESAHRRTKVDKVLVVDCGEPTQVARVMSRSGLTAAAAQAIMAQQATRAIRRACADAVIFNDGIALDELAQHVRSLWKRWVLPD
jgi:dephospho-CoA kinase